MKIKAFIFLSIAMLLFSLVPLAPKASSESFIPTVNLITTLGTEIQLPKEVNEANSEYKLSKVGVDWDRIPPEIFGKVGKYEITGKTITSHQSVKAIVHVFSNSKPIHIAAVGDSITYGMNIENPSVNGYPKQLNNRLGSKYKVTNFGNSGKTLLASGNDPYIKTNEYKASLDANPDVVIIQLGTNDAKPTNFAKINNYINDYVKLINTYKILDTKPIVYISLPPKVFKSAYLINPSNVEQILPKIVETAKRAGADVSIIDNHTASLGAGEFIPDGVHPNGKGAAILANNVYHNLIGEQPILAGKVLANAYDTSYGAINMVNASQSLLLTNIANRNWVSFKNVNFDKNIGEIELIASAPYDNVTVEVRLDSPDGMKIGDKLLTKSSGGISNIIPISKIVGNQDVFFVFTNPSSNANTEIARLEAVNFNYGAQGNESPIYKDGNQFQNMLEQSYASQNQYFNNVSIINDRLVIDMTKIWKGYGIKIELPNGDILREYKKNDTNAPETFTLDLRNRDLLDGFIQLRTLNAAFWGENSYENATIVKVPLIATGNGINLTEFGQAIYDLFSNDAFEVLQEGIVQKNIDLARVKMPEMPNSLEKTRLVTLLNKAEKLLHSEIYTAIHTLYADAQLTTLKETTNQKEIDQVQALIAEISSPTLKKDLQAELDTVKSLLEQRVQAEANNALNDLFQDDHIKDTITQQTIDTVKPFINKVTDKEVRADFQRRLDEAQAQFNAKSTVIATLALTPFYIGVDKYVTGTYNGNVAKISFFQNGVESKNASLKNGEFSFYVQDKKIKKTDTILMVAYDQSGKETVRQELKIIAETVGKIEPATMLIPGDKYITGTYTGDIARMEVTVNGVLYKGGTLSKGTFKFYSHDKITKPTDIVEVRVFDSNNKQLDKKKVSIKTPLITKGTIEITGEVVVGTKNMEGTYTGDVHYLVVTINGKSYKGGTINKDGTFKFYMLDKIKSPEGTITVEAFDKNGQLLNTKVIHK
ncbi:carbohydrate-binding protein [Listeria rocourtiae]|uniref:immunoglobulin-like domain-containing protein n=1 Tax=Listeria rocourtiae TaxID=647910 RepID=UPI0016236603|nr:immunoglobulin-like domain-containing protein [Listeria rocourtiae]MBC1434913.1 carbohydrate-binding protein [Listeria rocourtiae]